MLLNILYWDTGTPKGVQYLAQNYKCYWLLTTIALHSQLAIKKLDKSFQVWKLRRVDHPEHQFVLTYEDNSKPFYVLI
ncbi:DUF6876 family protein [Pedobacter westerhofensis]|uniref:DUF6876 family protein n=1 Tax=Pedobacter westerhofensis TaxID=425512 RepID=UPI003742DB48